MERKRYTVRIVLHGAEDNPGAYEILHNEMQKIGFTKTIESSDKKIYDLPPGEYNLISTIEIDQVLQNAQGAAQVTKHRYSVFVSQCLKRQWSNLTESDVYDALLHQIISE